MFHKDIKGFIKQHMDALLNVKVILYVCGIAKENLEHEVSGNLPQALQEHIQHIVFVNGILDFHKMNFMERKLIKIINKKAHFIDDFTKDTYVDLLDYRALDMLCRYVEET